jgi:Fur family ferric uptake transcriptional regulator
MSHHLLNYPARLRARGFRVTPQRQLILDAICEGHGHTTLEEIAARVQAKAPSLSRATVYRTLDFLCKMQLVVAAQIGGHWVYEIAGQTPHHHLICRACGAEIDLPHEEVKAFYAEIERSQHFSVETEHLALVGLCAECRRTGEPSPGHAPA